MKTVKYTCDICQKEMKLLSPYLRKSSASIRAANESAMPKLIEQITIEVKSCSDSKHACDSCVMSELKKAVEILETKLEKAHD